MRAVFVLVCASFLAAIAASPSLGDVVVRPIAALTAGPLPIEVAQIPVNLGATFERIDAISFSIVGDLPTHSWLSCDVNFGCDSAPKTFDSWGVNLYKPGFADHAVGYFETSGTTNLHLPLHDLGFGSDWSDLESGELSFAIYPIAEGIYIGTHYWDLISPPVVNLSTATLTITGELLTPPMPDYNGDNVVNAADYTVWRNGLGTTYSADDYDTWKGNFGAGGGSGAVVTATSQSAVPEPHAWLLASCLLVLFGSLSGSRWRSL